MRTMNFRSPHSVVLNLSVEALPEFRKLSGVQAQALMKRLEQWLVEHDHDTSPRPSATGRVRAGIGFYYFEEPVASTPKEH